MLASHDHKVIEIVNNLIAFLRAWRLFSIGKGPAWMEWVDFVAWHWLHSLAFAED